jgi:hypothetical protein
MLKRFDKTIPIYFQAKNGWKIDLKLIAFLSAPATVNCSYASMDQDVIWQVDCLFTGGFGRILSFDDEKEALAFHAAWIEYLKTQTIYI